MKSRLAMVEDWESLALQVRYHPRALARHCESSLRQLERFFWDQFGQAPQAWLNTIRLKRAVEMLAEYKSVKEVAFELGFNHPSHFIRWFRSRHGCTPMSFATDPVTRRCSIPAWTNGEDRTMRTVPTPLISLAAMACVTVAAVVPSEELPSQYRPIPAHRPDRILVQPKPDIDLAALTTFHGAQATRPLGTFQTFSGLQVLRVPEGRTVDQLIADYQRSGLVDYAEPDYLGHVFATPNDPKYLDGTLWGLNNTGQDGGVPGADIDAAAGWALRTCASNIVVAVIDTGVRYTHEDLAANMWVHPIDGSHGTNTLAGTTDPRDDSGHGTMIAGVLGAVGNNGKGVVGVAWRVQVMAVKSFDQFGVGSVSDAVAGLDYAMAHGANIINASWGFTNSMALSNAFHSVRDAGILVVAAAGNSGIDIDAHPTYPAAYEFDNILTVAYTTRRDELGTNSNYGATRVHLAAPGERIHSTFAATDTFYFHNTGTSFAASYVTGTLALMRAEFPTESHQQLIARLLDGVDPLASLQGKTVTGGRLNLRKALSPPPLTMIVLLDGPNIEITWTRPDPDHLYTLEARESLTSGDWAPIPGVAWPINTNRWTLPITDANSRCFRVRAEQASEFPPESVLTPATTTIPN
jgi:AraC-like DNA-binding protein